MAHGDESAVTEMDILNNFLVQIKFTGQNYKQWRFQIVYSLKESVRFNKS